MIDNFQIIAPFLDWGVNDFYFIQIIKRRKENPTLATNSVVIKDYFIYSAIEYHKAKDKIIALCNENNARAYIRINKRNAKVVATRMLSSIADLLLTENYRTAHTLFSKVAGEYHSDRDKKWLIDIDDMTLVTPALIEYLVELQSKTNKAPLVLQVPTKNGCHIITRPFNVQMFQGETFNLVNDDIKKDSPTILYIP